MALRVLLADESSTIKKVFQLALQDFAVEVRPVNIGIDVAAVAMGFKPDIIFADVLLQKKNGYEVCSDLKQDAHLRHIPVVLMWSGFMELDEDKFQACQANAQLEKPFDVQALRKLVNELVPRTQDQSLAQYLTFPKATAEAEKPMSAGTSTGAVTTAVTQAPTPAMATNKHAVPADEDDFQAVSIPKMKGEKYRLNLKPEDLDPSSIAVDYELPTENMEGEDPFPTPFEDEEFTVRTPVRNLSPEKEVAPEPTIVKARPIAVTPQPKKAAPPVTPKPAVQTKPAPIPDDGEIDLEADEEMVGVELNQSEPPPVPVRAKSEAAALTADQIEAIIRQQSAEVIESVVWKVIPELAKQIIERELTKLLKERDSHPY